MPGVTRSGRANAEPDDVPGPSGFHVRPNRPPWLTFLLFWVVVAAAVGFAWLFRVTVEAMTEWIAGESDAVAAASSSTWPVRLGVVAGAVIVAAGIGRAVDLRRGSATGIEAVAASARGEQRRISLRASVARAVATWLASVGFVSIGRESAIVEVGGAFGAVVGRRSGGRGDVMATVGIAAAFAAAYHAPVAAVLYVEEHLRVSRAPRALWFSVTSAAVGFVGSTWLLDGHTIFRAPHGSRWATLGLSLLVLVPAVVAARAFRMLRIRVKVGSIARAVRAPAWLVVAGAAIVAGVAIAMLPRAAGNGMDALREASVHATVAVGLALAVGKLIGTTAALGSGAPGGALTPTMSIAAGAALLAVLGVEELGVSIGADVAWGVMVSAMAVGVAVGLRSPLLAVVLVPELVGDYTVLPVIAVVVVATFVADRVVDRVVRRLGRLVPDLVYDDDA